jgi:hypothetical protein
MKNIIPFILFLLFIPMISLSQSESELKRQKRFDRFGYPNTIVTPTPYTLPYYNPYYNPYIPYYNNRYTHLTPYYGLPLTTPIKSENRVVFSTGILSTVGVDKSLPSFGLYTTIGNDDVFFKVSYEGSQFEETHYPNITIDMAEGEGIGRFNDSLVGDYKRYSSLFLGLGIKTIKSFYPFFGVNLFRNSNNLIYYDETYILSNNGLYSIKGTYKDGLNFRGGILYRRGVFEIGTHVIIPHPMRAGLNIGLNF